MVGALISARRFSRLSFLIFYIFLGLTFGCDRPSESPIKVSLSVTENEKTTPQKKYFRTEPLQVAVSAIISPRETWILYKDLLDYISKRLDVRLELIQRETYEEVNNLVRDNDLDLAFVCSGAYVDGHDQFGMELLVAPVAYGEAVYHSYIIVPSTSSIKSLEDLRGKRFAFTDPMSNTGKLAPTYMLSQMQEDIDSYFSKYFFTYSHDRSIEMVAHSLVDGAAVDSLIWEYMNSKNPSLTSKTKIIKKSDSYGIPPVVVPAGLDPALKEQLRKVFLDMNNDEGGRKILNNLLIDKFIIIEDQQYDGIRKMRSWLANK